MCLVMLYLLSTNILKIIYNCSYTLLRRLDGILYSILCYKNNIKHIKAIKMVKNKCDCICFT